MVSHAVVFAHGGKFYNASEPPFDRGDGDEVAVEAGEEGIRFLLVSGKPR